MKMSSVCRRAIAFLIAFGLASLPASAQLTNPSVTGPTSSTVGAFSLWGSATGDQITDSLFSLDQTSMGTNRLTLAPSITGNRTMTWPDKSGAPVINNIFDTFGSTFMAESLQWFNNADTSKRMKFDLSSVKTGETVVFQIPGDSSSTAGTKHINFPNFPSNGADITLLSNSGSQNVSGWGLAQATITNYLYFSDESPNLPFTPSIAQMALLNNGDSLDYYNGDHKLVHVSGMVRVELDFGTTPLTEKSFTITDTESELANSYIGLDNMIEAQIERHTSTGKTYVDEFDMDSFFVQCTPGSGSITCMVRCLTGQFRGTLNLDYQFKMPVFIN